MSLRWQENSLDGTLLHPLAATLARVSKTSEYLKTHFGVPEAAGWVRPADAFVLGSAVLAAQIGVTQQRLRTDSPSVVGGSLLQTYQWPLIHAAVGGYLADRRVPDVRPEEVWFHPKVDAEHEDAIDAVTLACTRFWALPDDPEAGHPDATILPGQAALRDRLRDMITAHFAPAVAVLCEALGCKERGLWLFVADGVAGTLAWTRIEHEPHASRSELETELEGLVGLPGSPLFTKQIGLFELVFRDQPRLQYDRATCCYWYKTADAKGNYCTTCPKRPKAERDALLLKYMAEEETAKTGATQEEVAA
jgi:hypothetical protein